MYRDVLVPTDGSDESLTALDEAADLANELGATLHVLYVVEPTTAASMGSGRTDVMQSMEEAGENAVERAKERAQGAGVENVEGAVRTGTVHDSIVSYVEDNDVDLVVMGTHGRTGLDRVLIGSVAEKVVRLSPVPVMTVGPKE